MTFDTALIAFGLLTFALIATEIMYTYATQGFGFGFSSNRPFVEKSGLALRIERIYKNQVESAAYVLPALLAGLFAGEAATHLEVVAMIVVLGRAVFSILYMIGLPFVRIVGFAMGSFGSLYIMVSLLSLG